MPAVSGTRGLYAYLLVESLEAPQASAEAGCSASWTRCYAVVCFAVSGASRSALQLECAGGGPIARGLARWGLSTRLEALGVRIDDG